MARVRFVTQNGAAFVDPSVITHITPAGLPGSSVLHSLGAPFFLIVLGEVDDVHDLLIGVPSPAEAELSAVEVP